MEDTKKCTKCFEEKKYSEFNYSKKNNDNLSYECKGCVKERRFEGTHSLIGKLRTVYSEMVSSQKYRTKMSGIEYFVSFTRKEFVNWGLSYTDYIQLHQQWVESGYNKMLSPSFDRIDDYGPYSFDNFNCWMTWENNMLKGHNSKKSGNNVKVCKSVRGTNIKTGEISEFYSIMEAERQTGSNQSKITSCCKGNRNKTNGYTWEYSDLNGDKQHDRPVK